MKSFTVGEPLQRMAIDVMGPLHETTRGNKYITVVMDYFTKWVELIATSDHTAPTLAQALVDRVFTKVGIPVYLHSDKGRDFCSQLFQKTCEIFGVDRTTTTPWRPQSDGMVERMNRTLGALLRQYVNADQDNWDDILPICAMAYNGSVHSSTGFSPYYLMYGHEMRLPLELVIPIYPEENVSTQETSVDQFVRRMSDTFSYVYRQNRQSLQHAMAAQKKVYDKRRHEKYYKPGDGVWLFNPKRRVGRTPKLDSPWEGPYTVIRNIGEVVCQIQQNRKSKSKIVHKDKLLPVKGEHDGSWVKAVVPIKSVLEDEGLEDIHRLFRHPNRPESLEEGTGAHKVGKSDGTEQLSPKGPITRSRSKGETHSPAKPGE